jgi:uncharacterized membrane protein
MPALALIFTVAFVAAAQSSAFGQETVVRTEIEALAGPGVLVTSINNHGTIVGALSSDSGSSAVPFRWTETRGVEFFLGNSPGQATDVNNRDAIVGVLQHSEESSSGFVWTPADGLVDLGSFFPAAINDRGEIAGSCREDVSSNPRPCLWEDGIVTVLGDGASSGSAFDISKRGHAAGQLLNSAFTWSPRAGLTLLPSSSGESGAIAAAMALNNSGEVVGFEAADGVVSIPVRWTRSGGTETFDNLLRGTFVSINASGLAAGRYLVEISGGVFEWYGFVSTRRGDVVDLGLGIPVAVNDGGAILGTTVIDGAPRVVVWRVTR